MPRATLTDGRRRNRASVLPHRALGLSVEEWRALVTARPNLLLVGDVTTTSAFLGTMWPAMPEPVWMTRAAPLFLPASSPGTLIVQNGTGLSAQDQSRLLQWLSDHQPRVQVITLSPRPLSPSVRRGSFLEALYYRLNVMYVELGQH